MARSDVFYSVGSRGNKKLSRNNALDWLRRHADELREISIDSMRVGDYWGSTYQWLGMTILFDNAEDTAKFVLKHLPTLKRSYTPAGQASVLPLIEKLSKKKKRGS